eukprot:gene11462-11608_t
MDWDWIGVGNGNGGSSKPGGGQQQQTSTWLSGLFVSAPEPEQAMKTAEHVAAALTTENLKLTSELDLLKAASSESVTDKAALEEKEKELVELQNQLNGMAIKMSSMRQELLAAQAKIHALSIPPPPAAAAGALSTNSTASGGSRACSGGEETAALEVAVRLSLLRGQLAAAEVAAAKAKLANLSMRQDVSQEMEDMTAVQTKKKTKKKISNINLK